MPSDRCSCRNPVSESWDTRSGRSTKGCGGRGGKGVVLLGGAELLVLLLAKLADAPPPPEGPEPFAAAFFRLTSARMPRASLAQLASRPRKSRGVDAEVTSDAELMRLVVIAQISAPLSTTPGRLLLELPGGHQLGSAGSNP